jgi:hypothetical protein
LKWKVTHRFDQPTRMIADRHYNRHKVGSPQFVPPGRCLVLLADDESAFWVTSWPFAEYVKHAWPGAWVCSAFRNEGSYKASELIREAVGLTVAKYGDPPELGMITFIDRRRVKPYVTPKGRVIYGQTFRQAGFREVGKTKQAGLLAFQMLPDRIRELV